MPRPFEHKAHLLRVAALFVGGVVVFLILQRLLVPVGFGQFGHYRPGALADNRSRGFAHAGRAACLDCHADAAEAAKAGPHERVHCEACHGPLARHAADPMEAKAVRPDSRVLCARCHQANVARPARFPQVEVADHAGGEACTSCHKAHDPRQLVDASAAAGSSSPAPTTRTGTAALSETRQGASR